MKNVRERVVLSISLDKREELPIRERTRVF